MKRSVAIPPRSRLLAVVCLGLSVGGLTACSVPPTSASGASDNGAPTESSTSLTLPEHLQLSVLQPFDAFSISSRQLATLSKALCYASSNQPSPASLGAVQKQWKVVALDWATASVFATGPSQTDNRHLRINAWPARPGLVEKQTRLLIHAAASLDGAELGDKVANGSAAIQGLPAAEYLLFNVLPEQLTGQEPGAGGGQIVAAGQIAETGQKTGAGTSAASFTDSCLALSAITAYMAQTATTLQLEWQQWPVLQSAMAALATATGIPDESKPVPEAYRQLQDKLLNGVLSHVRHLTRYKVGSLYEVSNDPDRLDGLEYHYSRQSVASIKAGIAGISKALDADGGLLAGLPATDPLLKTLQTLLSVLTDTAARLPDPIEGSSFSAQQVAVLQSLSLHLEALHTLLETQLIPALGLTVDFNSEDGD